MTAVPKPDGAQKPEGIECAKPADEEAILDLLRLKFEEDGGVGRFPLERARAFVKRGIMNRGGCIGVIRTKKRIEASVGVFLTDMYWQITQDEHLVDRWNFVHPQCRRSDHGKKLIDFARWVAQTIGRPWVSPHILNEQTASKCVLLERALGGAYGYLYIFDPAGTFKPRTLEATDRRGASIGRDLLKISKNGAGRLTRAGIATGMLAVARRTA